MSEAAQRLEETLVVLVIYQSTGVLEVTDDKKRWQFYLDGGALVGTRSNLKSESEEALRRALGDMSESALAQVQAARRIANACRATGATWAFEEGTAPPRPAPADVRRALFEAVSEARDEETLREILADLLASSPVADRFEVLGTGTTLDAYLANLDGSRPAEDVIDFAPVEPHAVLAGMWLGWRLGILGTGEEERADDAPEAGVSPAVADEGPTLIVDDEPETELDEPFVPPPSLSPLLSQVHEVDLRSVRAPPSGEAVSPGTEHPMAPVLRALAERFKAAKTHFDLLGESWDRSPETLRGAYMRLARDLHPDRYASAAPELADQATELFDQVRAAWEVLGDDDARKEYIDRVIHGKKSEEELAMEQVQQYLAAESEFKRGLAAFNAGQVSQALPLFRSAVEKAPEEVEFRAYLGYTQFFVNLKKDNVTSEMGFAMLQDAVNRNATQERKRDTLWVLLARALREKGDNPAARKACVGALRINASNPDATRLLRRMEEEETNIVKAERGLIQRFRDWWRGILAKLKILDEDE